MSPYKTSTVSFRGSLGVRLSSRLLRTIGPYWGLWGCRGPRSFTGASYQTYYIGFYSTLLYSTLLYSTLFYYTRLLCFNGVFQTGGSYQPYENRAELVARAGFGFTSSGIGSWIREYPSRSGRSWHFYAYTYVYIYMYIC